MMFIPFKYSSRLLVKLCFMIGWLKKEKKNLRCKKLDLIQLVHEQSINGPLQNFHFCVDRNSKWQTPHCITVCIWIKIKLFLRNYILSWTQIVHEEPEVWYNLRWASSCVNSLVFFRIFYCFGSLTSFRLFFI